MRRKIEMSLKAAADFLSDFEADYSNTITATLKALVAAGAGGIDGGFAAANNVCKAGKKHGIRIESRPVGGSRKYRYHLHSVVEYIGPVPPKPPKPEPLPKPPPAGARWFRWGGASSIVRGRTADVLDALIAAGEVGVPFAPVSAAAVHRLRRKHGLDIGTTVQRRTATTPSTAQYRLITHVEPGTGP
ncbi:MAG: hypothetical protein HQL42_19265 [Alphaproteobacteria bacterium]|nr:hypothetical protein [Alphaproteobacteria bacterium]